LPEASKNKNRFAGARQRNANALLQKKKGQYCYCPFGVAD